MCVCDNDDKDDLLVVDCGTKPSVVQAARATTMLTERACCKNEELLIVNKQTNNQSIVCLGVNKAVVVVVFRINLRWIWIFTSFVIIIIRTNRDRDWIGYTQLAVSICFFPYENRR